MDCEYAALAPGQAMSIDLGRGFSVKYSPEDHELVSMHKWRPHISKHGHAYAYTSIKGQTVMMHRMLLQVPKGTWVDHIDGDGLNNTRGNIRKCAPSENMANRAHDRRNKLGIKGVSSGKSGKFRAAITPNGKQIHLGTFATKEEAAAAYIGAARVLWGKFSRGS